MRLEFRSHSLRPSTLPVAVVILAVLMAGQAVAGKKGGKGKRSRNTAAASGQSEGPKQAKSARQGGCIIGGGYAPDGAPAGNNRLKPPTTAACDLNAVSGLSAQILSQMQKNGIKFVKLDTRTAKCDAPCIPILEAKAANALIAAAKSKGSSITLLGAWQSSAEQYLQYAWSNSGICNAGNVTVPGTGLYEGGRTISTQYYSFWKSTLQAFGWAQTYPLTDPTLFDYLRGTDYAKENLIAFEQLWNLHNPTRTIPEDGEYSYDYSKPQPDSTGGPNYHRKEVPFWDAPCNGWK